jgi:twitching motility protein PilT
VTVASKVAALVRNFLQTDGDALYLVAGEKIFITRGTARTVAGREVVSDDLFRAVVDELVPGIPAETLAQKRSRLPYVADSGLPPVEIHFAVLGGAPAMMIVRPEMRPGGELPRTSPPQPPPPEMLVPPAAIVGLGERSAAPPVGTSEGKAPGTPSPRPGGDAIETLLAFARETGASDLLLSPAERPLFRMDGSLVPAGPASPGGGALDAFVSRRAPARAAKNLSESGSARFVLEIEGAGRCLFRAARDRNGVSLAVRLLAAEVASLEALGLSGAGSWLGGSGPGLILAAGPPGSGRTTALAALAAHVAQGRGERVVTIEDPVEILIPPGRGSVSQRESGVDVPSVRAGLRAAAVEDADVVLCGSVPDASSAALLVELAASGRLVLAPIPAPSLSLALQWLDAKLPEGRRAGLRALLAGAFRAGVALALCRGRTGGRVVAAESLHPGGLVSELILSGDLAALPGHLRDSPGYVPLNTSLASLVANGLVEPREALLRSRDRLALLTRLREEGAALPPDLLLGTSHEGSPEA